MPVWAVTPPYKGRLLPVPAVTPHYVTVGRNIKHSECPRHIGEVTAAPGSNPGTAGTLVTAGRGSNPSYRRGYCRDRQ